MNKGISHLQNEDDKLTIAILGFGSFAQFLFHRLVHQGHALLAHSRSELPLPDNRIAFFPNPTDLCNRGPDIVLLASSILYFEETLILFPFHLLPRSTLVADLLPVKEFSKNLLLKHLPDHLDILCTHPMFAPGNQNWAGFPFMYDRVRITDNSRCEKFVAIFEREGCRTVEMACAEHDRYAACSQFLTRTMGRVLGKYGLVSSPIDSKGCERLVDLVEYAYGHNADVYHGLFLYNKSALQQLQRLESAFKGIKKQLFEKLHGSYRKQLF